MKMGKVKKMGKVMKMGKVKGAQWFAVAAAGLAAHAAVAQSPGRSTQLEEEKERQQQEINATYLKLDSVSNELDLRIETIKELGGEVDTLEGFEPFSINSSASDKSLPLMDKRYA